MLNERFQPTFESLPAALPVFPLDNVIIMPGAVLPLNIFEPRYLNMIEDAFKSHHLIGMVQPRPEAVAESEPALYTTGCAGRITSYSETSDGRMLISLTGVIRFDVLEELASIRGYRQVVPDWKPYSGDLDQGWQTAVADRQRLDRALRDYLQEREFEIDWESLQRLPDMRLVNLMATLLPLGSAEKQAILEAPTQEQRADLFISAIEIGRHEGVTPLRH
jgi:Lon protease-like protein